VVFTTENLLQDKSYAHLRCRPVLRGVP
jgi:hypothetical protein